MSRHLLWVNRVGALVDINRLNTTSGDYGQIYDAMKEQAGLAGRSSLAYIVELDPQQQIAGVYWDWELAGPGGARYRIHVLPGISDAAVAECKAHIRRSYDCLQLSTNRIKRLIHFQMPELKNEEIDLYRT